MIRLGHADLERVVELAGDIAALSDTQEPFPEELLERLRRLIGSDAASYSELDRVHQRALVGVGVGEGSSNNVTEEVFWALRHEWASCVYEDSTLDFGAHKLSDFVTTSQWRRTQIYNEYLRPFFHEISVGLPAPLTHTKMFLFFNREERGDFGERERTILEVLRPHLARRYENVALHRRCASTLDPGPRAAGLTPREREILHLVSEGRRNSDVATELWISPATVGKHLEHAYAKLGVTNRTAAVRRLREVTGDR